ncbi:hypothetical protein [Polaribacter sp.]|uniref:hypothetical protein n=1 Tax=Polaribacter sp. TaxID=1920175 RepID=UPI003F6C92B3
MIKQLFFTIVFAILITACSQDNDVQVARSLQEYIEENPNFKTQSVLAYAANAAGNINLTYIFYYPEVGATDIRYYELTDPTLDKDNFANYRRQSLASAAVFGGKLARFARSSSIESWCLVTFVKEGVLHLSDPINIKNISKSTEYSNEVAINYKTITAPNFTWSDGNIKENAIYFQVISDEENNFISGTYTEEKFFQFYDTSNVTLNINTTKPEALIEDEIYNFTLMGISDDNWVNLIIEKQFIPRNLEEFVAANSEKTIAEAFAFGATANGNATTNYIYYLPIENSFDFRYYETKNTNVDPTDYKNYSRVNLSSKADLGDKFRRFTKESSDEVWCLVTYIVDNVLYISAPIKTQNNTKPTEWSTVVDITYPETLKPVFTWAEGTYLDTNLYLNTLTKEGDIFLSGTFTKEKTFQYYNESNIEPNKIHTTTPPDLILDDEYQFSVFGLDANHWANLIIQNTFIAQ